MENVVCRQLNSKTAIAALCLSDTASDNGERSTFESRRSPGHVARMLQRETRNKNWRSLVIRQVLWFPVVWGQSQRVQHCYRSAHRGRGSGQRNCLFQVSNSSYIMTLAEWRVFVTDIALTVYILSFNVICRQILQL